MIRTKLKGMGVALITPFKEDDSVDYDALLRLVDYQLQNGTQVPDRTEWHNLVFWGGIAKTVEKYVHKGDKLYVEGTLRSRSYDDKNGVSRTIVEIYVNNMEMLSRNPQQGAAATTPSATQNPTVASGQSVDQPPF